MNIALVGHVDHGKTSLVKALSGVDTDRLAEEQQRGLSIDMGLAHVDWASDCQPTAFAETPARSALIDLPGHERFARNMLAGVARVDLGLLVVAADDGPMPQTHEHLAVLQLLDVPEIVIALNKVDRVSAERLDQARAELGRLVADGPYRAAPVFALSAVRGDGIAALRVHLAERIGQHVARRASASTTEPAGHFRLAIDRSFAVSGAGRVVTGAVLSGQVRVGDVLRVSPAGTEVRVRGLQAQNRLAERAVAGQRCALNLSGADLRQAVPQRGDWVLAPAAHAPTDRLDVWLQVLASEPRPLADRQGLQLHIGAAAVAVRVAVLQGRAVAPGEAGWVQLVTHAPVAAVHGDRLVLRDAAAHRTLGGGWVADPFGPTRGRARVERLQQLAGVSQVDAQAALAAALQSAPVGLDLARFALARNLRADELAALLRAQPLHQIDPAAGALAFNPPHWQVLCNRTLQALANWHQVHPHSLGPTASALAAQERPRLPLSLWRELLGELAARGLVSRLGLCWHRPDHQPRLDQADAVLLAKVVAAIRPGGLRPPRVGELAEPLGLPLPDLMNFLDRAAATGQLVRVASNRYYLPESVPELVAIAQQLADASADGSFTAAAYKEHSGIGRNLSVQVLEFLDREGFTQRNGDSRRMLAAPRGYSGDCLQSHGR